MEGGRKRGEETYSIFDLKVLQKPVFGSVSKIPVLREEDTKIIK